MESVSNVLSRHGLFELSFCEDYERFSEKFLRHYFCWNTVLCSLKCLISNPAKNHVLHF